MYFAFTLNKYFCGATMYNQGGQKFEPMVCKPAKAADPGDCKEVSSDFQPHGFLLISSNHSVLNDLKSRP